MAIIPQPSLFSWKEVDASTDIVRLKRVLDVLPDEALMRVLEGERKGKRDDAPVRAMWNALIAAVVFGHVSIAALLRELGRNGELHDLCGFHPGAGAPSESAFSRFLAKVRRHRALVEAIFETMVERLALLLPDYGRNLAIDGKDIKTHGRNDPDANFGAKTYWDEADGSLKEIRSWFGYKLHLVVDADYELPVAWELTPASVGESPRLMALVESIELAHPQVLARTETLAADRGYDDGEDKATLYDIYGITPVMDTRDMAKGVMKPLDETHHDTIYTNPTGTVCCKIDPFEPDDNKAYANMQFMGFEKDRETLKYRCPAAAFGLECRNRAACRCRPQVREGEYGRVVRVPLSRDRRVFLPMPRHSQGFEQAYKKRTAAERVNSRIDQVYGFERHFIRGMENMKMRVGLALLVMLATAVAWIEAGKPQRMCSLVRAA
jgi:hypothetical protein